MLPGLFPQLEDEEADAIETSAVGEAAPQGPFAAVALEQSVDRELDYVIPARLIPVLRVGQRVRVPLGRKNRVAHGYVISIHPTSTYPRIKTLFEIDDQRVLVPPKLMELSRWMSRYYCAPLGTVLESVVPSAVKKKIGIGYTQMVRLAPEREAAQELLEKCRAPKRRAILGRMLQLEPQASIPLHLLAAQSGTTPATIRRLVKAGLVHITPEVDLPRLGLAAMQLSAGDEPDHQLNVDQQKVFDELSPRMKEGGFSVNLLLGVTGSGKTEVYLRCIREAVQMGRQAIVLVPEIALTPQTVRRFIARFQSVAVLHSGLTATERHRYWQMIAMGKAQVVVGARSAIFAPVPNLGVIVVDEEHESSYKQDQAPRYHARDITIKRAQLEKVPVILGSATPSLETYVRVMEAEGRRSGEAIKGKIPVVAPVDAAVLPPANPVQESSSLPFLVSPARSPVAIPRPSSSHLLSLPTRVRGLAMPHVELIDMKVEKRFRRGVHLLSQRLEHLLRVTVESGHQAILLLNRRGYSNFVYCSSCTNVIQCRFCDATMTYHRSAGAHVQSAKVSAGLHTGQLHCHYCLAVNKLPDKCPTCGKLLSLFGLGTQRVEEEITKKFPALKFARVDSDTMRNSKDYEALLGRFGRGEVQVLLGTQMIAKGLDYPNVTLVGVISGDTALALPDFRAAERTFQLITQVAGRAGRGDNPGRVVLQTFLPDDAAIQSAIKQDFAGFAAGELKHRLAVGLPPYGRMVRIIMRDEEPEKLHKRSEELAAIFSEPVAKEGGLVEMKGPMPCAIARIAGYHRAQIVMTAATAQPLQRVLAAVREKGGLAKADRVAVDVDPVSLL